MVRLDTALCAAVVLGRTAMPTVTASDPEASAYVARSTVRQPRARKMAAAAGSSAAAQDAAGAMPTRSAMVCCLPALR